MDHLDVTSAFLNDEIIQRSMPRNRRVIKNRQGGYDIKNKKALYELKHALKTWYSKLDNSLVTLGV